MTVRNYLVKQYAETGKLEINHNYLERQFADYPEILEKIAQVVRRGDFTLGRAVDDLEQRWARTVETRHAIGVGSGTDALFLSLKALGVGPGDEVITTPFTFYATIGAIVTAGARPVFADVLDDFNIDPEMVSSLITKKTKAILPVHWSGKPCRMDEIMQLSRRHDVPVVEDACHGILAAYKNKKAGSFGATGCFSMHPLKNLNVWGDGGIICTNDDDLADRLRLMRNHGLVDRDHCSVFAYNSRLDTIQAVVADHLMNKLDHITERRIANARHYDQNLMNMENIDIPPRDDDHIRHVYHIYSLKFQKRDELQRHLLKAGVDAKVHYPIPMHLQPAARAFGHKRGDFPKAEATADTTLSLPVHEFITAEQQNYVIGLIKDFYR